MKRFSIAAACSALFVAALFAADTYTPLYHFRLPNLDEEDYETPWGKKYNDNFLALDAALSAIDASSGTIVPDLASIGIATASLRTDLNLLKISTGPIAGKVNKTGDTMSGALVVNSSVTAHDFYGNGGHLTGIGLSTFSVMPGSVTYATNAGTATFAPNYVMKAGDYMTGFLRSTSYYITTSSLTASNGYFVGYPTAPVSYLLAGTGGTLTSYIVAGSTIMVHTFVANGDFTPPTGLTKVRALIVGGGGPGGSGGCLLYTSDAADE